MKLDEESSRIWRRKQQKLACQIVRKFMIKNLGKKWMRMSRQESKRTARELQPETPVVKVENLSKSVGPLKAVDSVSVEIKRSSSRWRL